MANEEQIISLIAKDKDKGFELMMNTYRDRIYWYIRRTLVSKEDAEDVFQETFIKAYRFIDKFKRNSSIYTWLYTIAVNECKQLFRSRKLITTSYDSTPAVLTDKLAEESVEGDKLLVSFQKAILSLPEKQREVFSLRYYDELSYKEIAEITGNSEGTLKTNYHYAVARIKAIMVEE